MLVNADSQADRDREIRGVSPRRDYRVLAERLGADIHDAGRVNRSLVGRTLRRFLGRGAAQVLSTLTAVRRYDVVFSDNEYTGLLMSVALRVMNPSARHVMLAHHLTPRKKRLLARLARGRIDRLILHSHAQEEFARATLGFAPRQIAVLPYQVDTEFWQGSPAAEADATISTAGLECRDYETLLKAVEGLPAQVVIAAASNWSTKRNTLSGRTFDANVTVKSFDYAGLRALYDKSRFVVVPLLEIDFQAGITTVLEGMSMGKAVILTETRGQLPVVRGPRWWAGLSAWPDDGPAIEDSSGIYIAPYDAAAWRSAISYLLENPHVAAELGRNARLKVESDLTVEQFAERFSAAILTAGAG